MYCPCPHNAGMSTFTSCITQRCHEECLGRERLLRFTARRVDALKGRPTAQRSRISLFLPPKNHRTNAPTGPAKHADGGRGEVSNRLQCLSDLTLANREFQPCRSTVRPRRAVTGHACDSESLNRWGQMQVKVFSCHCASVGSVGQAW